MSPCWVHLSVHTFALQLTDGSLSAFRWHHQHQWHPFSSWQQDFVRAFICLGPSWEVKSVTRRRKEMKVQILRVALQTATTVTFKVKHFSKIKPLQKVQRISQYYCCWSIPEMNQGCWVNFIYGNKCILHSRHDLKPDCPFFTPFV